MNLVAFFMKLSVLAVLAGTLFSCTEEKISQNELVEFFYPMDSIPKIYCYRNAEDGLHERFDRVYSLEDSYGKHIVVEHYSEDGRILEAFNYNLDSLRVLDHMVVDIKGHKTQAMVLKNALFPFKKSEKTWYASKFKGSQDSTMILTEVLRGILPKSPINFKNRGETKPTLVTTDTIRVTEYNPFTREEKETVNLYESYFAKGVGLVRFRDKKRKTDYVLEKIISQKEWLKALNK